MSFFSEPMKSSLHGCNPFEKARVRCCISGLAEYPLSATDGWVLSLCHSRSGSTSCWRWTRLDASLPNSLMTRNTICQDRKSHMVVHKRLLIRILTARSGVETALRLTDSAPAHTAKSTKISFNDHMLETGTT
ncbi:hypothetical protein CHARACLAT_026568 [Characodon lateralis]|uniref:Uncharacterized protein n=1 Tax=Characodon lateralis TaxID=208331 RepID=A0ABU7DXZ5_9TELE|nr:hypothetical protein [Characodon lateralis]